MRSNHPTQGPRALLLIGTLFMSITAVSAADSDLKPVPVPENDIVQKEVKVDSSGRVIVKKTVTTYEYALKDDGVKEELPQLRHRARRIIENYIVLPAAPPPVIIEKPAPRVEVSPPVCRPQAFMPQPYLFANPQPVAVPSYFTYSAEDLAPANCANNQPTYIVPPVRVPPPEPLCPPGPRVLNGPWHPSYVGPGGYYPGNNYTYRGNPAPAYPPPIFAPYGPYGTR